MPLFDLDRPALESYLSDASEPDAGLPAAGVTESAAR